MDFIVRHSRQTDSGKEIFAAMIPVMLYFGSFNPPHKGHIAIAEYVLRQRICEEVWLVVSPHSPFKSGKDIVEQQKRIEMCTLAAEQSAFPDNITVCDIESVLPKPSYTYLSLRTVAKLFPGVEFHLLMGADNAAYIEEWKNWREIVENHKIFVYPREGVDISGLRDDFFHILRGAPQYDISSTRLRMAIVEGEEFDDMVGDRVYEYIKENHLYEYDGTGQGDSE